MSLSSTAIFYFLLRKDFETYQVYYTILFTAFEFLFLNRFSVILNDFFHMAYLQVSSQQIFSINKLYYVILQSFFCVRFFWVQFFQGPGFPGSEFRVWAQVLEVAQIQCVHFLTVKKKKYENKTKVYKFHQIHHYTIIKQMLE